MTSTPGLGKVIVAISIDTEEDDWGSYAEQGASTRNIPHLEELQDLFDRWSARPTYLINRPPLVNGEAVKVLGTLSMLSRFATHITSL